MANNNDIFDAAYEGALAGFTTRWLIDESVESVNVENGIAAAVAFATMMDSLISASVYTDEECSLLYSLCNGVWQSRIGLSNIPSEYSRICSVIHNIFKNAKTNLLKTSENEILTFELGLCQRTTMNLGRAIPVQVANKVKISKIFTYIYATNTASNIEMGVYSAAGQLLSKTATFVPVNGQMNVKDLLQEIELQPGLNFFAFNWATGANIILPYGHVSSSSTQQLGASMALGALPATITINETTNYVSWFMGVR
jgi:hypothetical protein